jgi:hypothetical protein
VKSASELFWPRVETGWTDQCWEWTGPTLKNGYGQFGSGKNRGMSTLAHRASYTMIKGDPGDDMQVDRLCHNKACVNPQHLEAVTPQINTQRARSDGLIGECRNGNQGKTRCPEDHPYSGENLIIRRGKRHCRECGRKAAREYQRRKRALAQQGS